MRVIVPRLPVIRGFKLVSRLMEERSDLKYCIRTRKYLLAGTDEALRPTGLNQQYTQTRLAAIFPNEIQMHISS